MKIGNSGNSQNQTLTRAANRLDDCHIQGFDMIQCNGYSDISSTFV